MNKKSNQASDANSIFKCVAILALLALCSCASVPSEEEKQQVHVTALLSDGAIVNGARCELTNNKGAWSVMTPGAVDVLTSESPLQVTCQKEGYRKVKVSIGQQVDGQVIGDLGGLGKLVIGGAKSSRSPFFSNDSNAPSHLYPSAIKVSMTQLEPNSGNKKTFGFDEAQKKCEEIGLRKGTENFGMCVMKLMD
jgi:hypothetical protein